MKIYNAITVKMFAIPNDITIDGMELHHLGESGYGRGMNGSKRNDMTKSEALGLGLKNWAIGLCIPCHRKETL